MLNYYNFEQFKNNFGQRKQTLSNFVTFWSVLFGDPEDETVWNWLENLQELLGILEIEKAGYDFNTAFQLTLVEELDWEKIDEIIKKLEELNELLKGSEVVDLAEGEEGVQEIVEWLELSETQAKIVINKINSLPDDKLSLAVPALQELIAIKEEIRPYSALIFSLLLVSLPINTPTTFKQFQDKMDTEMALEGADIVHWAPIMRALGQAVLGQDAEIQTWAVNYYAENLVARTAFEQTVPHLLLLAFTYLFFKDFKNLDKPARYMMVNNQLWPALCLGVPVEELLKEQLADEDLLADYIYTSSYYADLMLDSKQRFIYFGFSDLPAGDVIGDFEAFCQGNDLELEKMDEFAKKFILENSLRDDFREKIVAWLKLYVHLRECDLVDFRGELAEAGLRPWFDWNKYLDHDVTDLEADEAKRYLQMIRRPVYMKVKIINALQDLAWSEEPVLSRALALSDIYFDIYGDPYGQLVYFDEEKGEFKLNMDLPDLTNQFYEFAKGEVVDESKVIKY